MKKLFIALILLTITISGFCSSSERQNWFVKQGNNIVALLQAGWNVSIAKLNGVIYIDGRIYPQTLVGLQAALDAQEAAGGGVVEIPAGVTIIIPTNTSHVWIPSNVTLRGTNTTATIKLADNINPNWEADYYGLITNKGWDESTPVSNIKIENLTVDGNKANNATGQFNCISIGSGTNITIKGCIVKNASRRYTTGEYYQGCGILAAKLISSVITENYLENNDYDGVRLEAGVDPNDGCKYVVVSNNVCRGNVRNGIKQFGGYYNTIIGNTIYGGVTNTLSGITVDYGWNSQIIGNSIAETTGVGINVLSTVDNYLISGNVVTGVTAGSGIRVWCQSVSAIPADITIDGNLVSNCSADGISFEGSVGTIDNSVISNNILSANGVYGIDIGNARTNGAILSNNTYKNNVSGTLYVVGAVGVNVTDDKYVVNVGATSDIEAACNAAPIGTLIKLAPNTTYVLPNTLDIAKALTIEGGQNTLLTYTVTSNTYAISVTASNVVLRNLNITGNFSTGTGGAGLIRYLGTGAAQLTGGIVENCNLIVNTDSQIAYGLNIGLTKSMTVKNCNSTIASTAALSAYGFFNGLSSTATEACAVNFYGCTATVNSGAGTNTAGFAVQDNSSPVAVVSNLYGCRTITANGGTNTAGAIAFSGADAVLNIYDGGSYNGTGYGLLVQNGASINIYGATTLVNSVISAGVTFNLTSATKNIQIGGQSASIISQSRNLTSNTAGSSLAVNAGGATVGATDKDGGMLTLSPGVSTGTGKSSIRLQSNTRAASTGTTTNTLVDRIIVPSRKYLSDGVATGLFEVALGSNTMTGGTITYTIYATEGTDFQAHTGIAQYCAVSKGATITAAVGHASPASGLELDVDSTGTLTDTWSAVEADAGKITFSVNADSSLTAPVVYIDYVLHNDSPQAVTQL